uniref:Immunoglobulin V-set domain-containing protein n=1 Tax=Cyprinus carpio carpio TaxID=630221 RepID=A0A9J8BHP1_CYPCA
MEQSMKSGSYLYLQLYRDTKNTFRIVLFLLLLNDAFAAETDKVKVVSVKEGENVALRTGETEIQRGDKILWMYGDERTLLAEIHMRNKIFETYNTDDGRFSDSLELDKYTGSLVIRNTKSTHSGVYHLKIIKKDATVYKRFQVNINGGGALLDLMSYTRRTTAAAAATPTRAVTTNRITASVEPQL